MLQARRLGAAICVQRFDDSLNPAIHITYRVSRRSSSLREPRDPSLIGKSFGFVFMLLRKPKFTLQAKVGGLGEKRKVEPADYETRLSIRARYAVERFCENN